MVNTLILNVEKFKTIKDARARLKELNENGTEARLYKSHRCYAVEYRENKNEQ